MKTTNFAILYTCLLLLMVCISTLSGKVPTNEAGAQKLKEEIAKIDGNTKAKADMLFDLGFYVLNSDVDSAGRIFDRVKEVSEAIDYNEGLINHLAGLCNVLNYKGEFQKGLELNLEGVGIAREVEDRTFLAKQLANTGISYSYLGDFEKAIEYARESLEIFRDLDDKEREARMLLTIGLFYNNLSANILLDSAILAQAIAYYQEALPLSIEIRDTFLQIEVLSNLGLTYNNARNYEEAGQFLGQAEELANEFGTTSLLETIYRSKSTNLRERGFYEEAIDYAGRALEISRDWGASLYGVLTKKELALAYSKNGQFEEAIGVLEEVLPIAESENMSFVLDGLYQNYGENLAEVGQFDKAYSYYVKGSTLADSVRGAEMKSQLIDLEKKYQSAKKDAQILQLEVSQEKQKWWIMGLVLGLVLIGLVGFVVIKRYQYRAAIAEQERLRLSREQQLRASESIIQGQEEERERIARDLHDGLGGLLSGLKYTLNTMEGNVILSESSAHTFHKALDQLDLAISEMRKVAHNMMPEALVNFGLDDTLKDFVSSLSESIPMRIHYQSFGYRRLPQKTEIILYRIIQESINNSLKHAEAEDVYIQINQDDEYITISIEDNGKGFDVGQVNKGIGLKNIQNRVAFLNGEIDISSNPGQGTIIVIQINIEGDDKD